MRHFLTWAECAARLNTDSEGLRQILELGGWRDLPAYLRADRQAYLATMDGEGVALSKGFEGFRLYSRWDNDEPTHLKDGRTLPAWEGHDDFCEWDKQETSHSVTGYPAVYLLSGFLRVDPGCVHEAALRGRWDGIGVFPPSWWENDGSPVPLDDMGRPMVRFVLLRRGEGNMRRGGPEALEELWFHTDDVGKMASATTKPEGKREDKEGQERPSKLRSDREQNLLRVIAALWTLSDLPKEHNTAADKLSALMDGWRWDKPAASTIADTILKEAANLPGAKVRT